MTNSVTASRTYIPRDEQGVRRTPAEVLNLLCDAGDTLRGLRINVGLEIGTLIAEEIDRIAQAVKIQSRLLPPPCLYLDDDNATRMVGRRKGATGMKRRCRSTARHNGPRRRANIPC